MVDGISWIQVFISVWNLWSYWRDKGPMFFVLRTLSNPFFDDLNLIFGQG